VAQIQKQLDYIRERYGSLSDYVAEMYGTEASFSEVGDFCLIHLDNPSKAERQRRVDEFSVNDHFPDDCPICEMQKEMGGFIVFDGSDGSEHDSDQAFVNPQNHELRESREVPNIPKDSLWRQSYLNMESLREHPPDLKVNMLLMNLWSNIVELKADLQDEAPDRVTTFATEFKASIKNVQLLLMMPERIIPWNEMEPSFKRVKNTAAGLLDTSASAKIKNFSEKLDLFIESIQELLIHRSLLRN